MGKIELKEGKYYQLHDSIVPIYIKVDSIYTIDGLLGETKYISYFLANFKFPRISKYSKIERVCTKEISEDEYKYFKI